MKNTYKSYKLCKTKCDKSIGNGTLTWEERHEREVLKVQQPLTK